MTVEIWFRDHFDTERVEGDLVSLTNALNVAHANGKQFAIFADETGHGVMIETKNIVKAREVKESDDSVIGR